MPVKQADIETQLLAETDKWLNRIKTERPKVELLDRSKADLLKNLDAYIADSEYFAAEGKLIEAFEAVVWAWAHLELLERLGVLKRKS